MSQSGPLWTFIPAFDWHDICIMYGMDGMSILFTQFLTTGVLVMTVHEWDASSNDAVIMKIK